MAYSLNDKALIWLNLFDFLSLDKKHTLLSMVDEPKELFSCFKDGYSNFSNLLTLEQFNKMNCSINESFIENEIVSLDLKNIKVLTYLNPLYPQEFLNYDSFPILLYCIGDENLLSQFSIAVVGTRKITKYGTYVTETIVKNLAQNGIIIVSGMAGGVDSVAHSVALNNGAKTIAVLGSGFDNIYPKTNFELFKKICENGLVISEYRPDIKPLAYNFPVRNRIIAMISNAIVMTEAGLKSGALYTINYGIEYGKEIFVVPGNIDNFSSQGCNQIIKNCQASLITCADDILQHFEIENQYHQKRKSIQLSVEEEIILKTIGNDELSFDEIVTKTNFDTKTLIRLLTTLELSGLIKKSMGNFYSKIAK